jgi:hypothetical protein
MALCDMCIIAPVQEGVMLILQFALFAYNKYTGSVE